MASPLGPGVPETLVQGRSPRLRPPHQRRRLAVLAVVLLLLAGAGVVLDHRARARESLRVDACARAATSAVLYASNRVDAITSYVRPALDAGPRDRVRRQLVGLVSLSVSPTVDGVRRARDRCADTEVAWFHDGLETARRDCLLLLDRDLAYLRGVTGDGMRGFATRSLPAGRCTG